MGGTRLAPFITTLSTEFKRSQENYLLRALLNNLRKSD